MRARILAFAAATCGVAAAGCSSNSSGPPPSDTSTSSDASSDGGVVATPVQLPICDGGGLTVAFNPMYSAYDGTHTFSVPAVVIGSNTNVVWSADSTYVGMMQDNERPNEVLLTTLAAGTTTIVVQSVDGTKCGSATLIIDQTTTDNWMIGEARYNDGNSLILNSTASTGSGSALEPSDGGGGPACTGCHGETATGGLFTDVSHTPEQTGGFSDQDLLNIILHGNFPDGGYFDTSIVKYSAWHAFHQWSDIMPSQQEGIITYLRSLTPEPQNGEANFGGTGTTTATDGGSETDAGPTEASIVEASSPVDSGVDATMSGNQPEAGPPEAGPDASDAGSAEIDAPAEADVGD